MIRTIFYRICLTILNILFPPAVVLILTGPGMDTFTNCFLFLLAVIPSHVHGFYINWVYFSRRHKAKRGRYPGRPHSFIYSDKVNNGGLTDAEVEDLWLAENGLEKRPSQAQRGRKGGRTRPEQRLARTLSQSSAKPNGAPRLPPPSPLRPRRSSSQRSGDVVRSDLSPRPSSTNSQRGARRSQSLNVGYAAQGSAPLRGHPAAGVLV